MGFQIRRTPCLFEVTTVISNAILLVFLCLVSGCSSKVPTRNDEVTDDWVLQLCDEKRLHQLPGARDDKGKPVTRDGDIFSIELFNSPVTSKSVDQLLASTDIRWLFFHADQVNDDIFQTLLKNDSVHRWSAYQTGAGGRTADGFASADDSQIVELKLNRTVVSPASLELAVNKLKNLRRIDLSEFILDEQAVTLLLPRKQVHVLRRGPGFERAFNEAGQQATNDDEIVRMQLASLHNDWELTKSTLPKLKQLKNLREIDVDLTDDVLELLANENMLHLLTGAFGEEGKRVESDDEIADLTIDVDTRSGRINDFSFLTQLPKLASLDISGCPTQDPCLSTLKGLNDLKFLAIGQGVTDVGLTLINELTSIEDLAVRHSKVRGEGLKNMTSVNRLKKIEFVGNSLDAKNLIHLKLYPNLKTIVIDVAMFDDNVLAGLVETGMLNQSEAIFDKMSWPLVQAKSKEFSGDESIEELNLGNLPLYGSTLSHLEKLPNLSKLSLNSTLINDVALETLRELPKLEHVDLRGCELSKASVTQLQEDLAGCQILFGPAFTPPANDRPF